MHWLLHRGWFSTISFRFLRNIWSCGRFWSLEICTAYLYSSGPKDSSGWKLAATFWPETSEMWTGEHQTSNIHSCLGWRMTYSTRLQKCCSVIAPHSLDGRVLLTGDFMQRFTSTVVWGTRTYVDDVCMSIRGISKCGPPTDRLSKFNGFGTTEGEVRQVRPAAQQYCCVGEG